MTGVRRRPEAPLPEHRRPTIKDIAAAAGVSRSAASRALRGTGYVGEASRERVLEAAAELGYVPHVTARSLKQRVSRCIGVLCRDLASPRDAAVVAGVCARARQEGFATMVADLGGRAVDPVEALEDFVAFGVAGAVVDGPVVEPAAGADPLAYLARYGIPTVVVGREDGRGDAVVGERGPAEEVLRHRVADGVRVVVVRTPEEARRAAAAEGPSAVLATTMAAATTVWRSDPTRWGAAVLPDGPDGRVTGDALVCAEGAASLGASVPGVLVLAPDPHELGRAAVECLLRRFADADAGVRTVSLPLEARDLWWAAEPHAAGF